ncbi:MAG: YkgJ family cysteine cluster protein [Cellvibrionaceae bacterium]
MKECNSCGKCCVKYGGGGLAASEADLESWELFSPVLFRYVKRGKIWFDPTSGHEIDHCPWLKVKASAVTGVTRYECSIYFDRPEDCRHYPSTVEEMVRDGCEMIEVKDLNDIKRAQRELDRLMAESRPARHS